MTPPPQDDGRRNHERRIGILHETEKQATGPEKGGRKLQTNQNEETLSRRSKPTD